MKYIKIIYMDNGPGIPDSLKSKVFEAFFSTSGGGSGLGLTGARANAQRHGGTLIETGEDGSGVRFELYLPTGGK